MIIFSDINWDLILGDGITITIIGYLIVFLALVLLASVFFWIPKLLQYRTRQRIRSKGKNLDKTLERTRLSGEEGAAIGTAFYLYFNELHDTEDPVITIKRISKNYSPWSSKIYGVTRGLNRRF